MKRFLKVFGLLSIILFFASCKSDDDTKIAPPRDYGVQYAEDKADIEEFLKNHYFVLDAVTLDATFHEIPDKGTQISVWDQTEYPLQNIKVKRNDVEYTVYYLNFREGVGEQPTMADNITVNYRGTLLDGTQFDYRPIAGTEFSLNSVVAVGWQSIIPLFKSGIYSETEPGEPASYTDYGAGAMFLPSGLAYFNSTPSTLVPMYSPMVFTFQLMDVTYTDIDADGILNKDETVPGTKIQDYDSDGDGTPNYLDVDDDNDGRLTKDELRKAGTTNEYYTYAEMFDEQGNMKPDNSVPGKLTYTCRTGATVPSYLDAACKGGN
ncbi:Peptidyl-prolyl cis-trans isomerase Mip precursor [compost metagenome]